MLRRVPPVFKVPRDPPDLSAILFNVLQSRVNSGKPFSISLLGDSRLPNPIAALTTSLIFYYIAPSKAPSMLPRTIYISPATMEP